MDKGKLIGIVCSEDLKEAYFTKGSDAYGKVCKEDLIGKQVIYVNILGFDRIVRNSAGMAPTSPEDSAEKRKERGVLGYEKSLVWDMKEILRNEIYRETI